MSDTQVNSANEVSQWADDEFYEYVRMNPLRSLMGTDENSVIQVKEELTKEDGDAITVSLVTRLQGDGVTGDDELHGNEEALGNYGQKVSINQIRNGVIVGRFEKIKTKIDLLNAARKMLRLWNMEKLRDLILARFMSPVTDGITTYAAATEAQKDAWETANDPTHANSRVLFGAALANQSGDHSADLLNIDGTADDLSPDIVRLLKRMMQSADPHIRPVVEESGGNAGKEKFYMLAGSRAFRDLQANMDTIHQNADVRGQKNYIFSGDNILVGNVEVIEMPEMDRDATTVSGGCRIPALGAGGIDVSAVFGLGAQAGILAWGQRMQIVTDEWDYKNKRGVATSEIRGAVKTTMNLFQHGMGTAYVSAVGD